MTIRVLYTCRWCGLQAIPVDVPERDPAMNIVDWVRNVVGAMCGLDHTARNPACPSSQVDLAIPMPAGADYIGQPIKH